MFIFIIRSGDLYIFVNAASFGLDRFKSDFLLEFICSCSSAWIEHRTSNPRVVGSNPIGSVGFESTRCAEAHRCLQLFEIEEFKSNWERQHIDARMEKSKAF